MKKLAVAVCLLMMPFTLAWSAGYGIVYGAKVVNIRVDQTGLGMVFFDQPIVNTPPTCVIPMYSKALAFNAATAGGKAILALALTARLTGTPINYVVGSGTCSIYSNFVEDWGYNE